MRVREAFHPDEINNSEKHILFIEGKDNNSVDSEVLRELLDNSIAIESLGPSYHITSVAEALYHTHRHYYFLVDRDDSSDEIVEKSWTRFPDPDHNNLLYWKRKEFENYFLVPDFICSSSYFHGTKEAFITKLETEATKRVFLDAANLVICHVRNEQKKNWIQFFKNIADFKTKESALESLLSKNEYDARKNAIADLLDMNTIKSLFNEKITLLLGNGNSCIFGEGRWLELMSGKELLKIVINSSFFKGNDAGDKPLQGDEKLKVVLKEVVRQNNQFLPEDFAILKRLIDERVNLR